MRLLPLSDSSGWSIASPAKVNLFLEVVARRPDGFHELATLFARIDPTDPGSGGLVDALEFRPAAEGIESLEWIEDYAPEILGSGVAGLPREPLPPAPAPADNLALRAVRALREATGVRAGLRMRLIKRIPPASGLGGGSGNAAAALQGAARVWGVRVSTAELHRLGTLLGSDVPFFLPTTDDETSPDRFASAASATGRGEILTPVAGLAGLHLTIVRPPVGLSTPAVFRRCTPAAHPRSFEPLISSLQAGDSFAAGALLHNGLQGPAETLSPWIGRILTAFERFGLPGTRMSGSGSACFGLCRDADQARDVAAALRAAGLGRVWAVRTG